MHNHPILRVQHICTLEAQWKGRRRTDPERVLLMLRQEVKYVDLTVGEVRRGLARVAVVRGTVLRVVHYAALEGGELRGIL